MVIANKFIKSQIFSYKMDQSNTYLRPNQNWSPIKPKT